MSAIPDVFRFSIYRKPLPDLKRQAESRDIMPLLLRLDEFIQFADVTFGDEPPDFVFHHLTGTIGVELTDLYPKVNEKGGHHKRAEFKSFETEVAKTLPDQSAFPWDKVSCRESLEAFKAQLETKRKKAQPWFSNFTERWLLMHVTSGSPFGEILNGEQQQTTPSTEKVFADYSAKLTHELNSICQEAHPFDHVILFRESNAFAEMLVFSPSRLNPYKLPVPQGETLNRGEKMLDSFLDFKIAPKSVIKRYNKLISTG
jgi:hypothetical protein